MKWFLIIFYISALTSSHQKGFIQQQVNVEFCSQTLYGYSLDWKGGLHLVPPPGGQRTLQNREGTIVGVRGRTWVTE